MAQREPNAGVRGVSLHLPKFWSVDLQVWFGQVESQFMTAHITNQISKFHHVIAAVPREVAMEVRDFVIATPKDMLYDKLRNTLIQRNPAS